MDLWELIEANKRGRSVRELMQDSAGHISDRNYFMEGSIKKKRAFPAREKILGLASALEVSPLAIVLASAESLGLANGANVPEGDNTALQAAQARADRLQTELDTTQAMIRKLNSNVNGLLAARATHAPSDPVELQEQSEEIEYWRHHALRYRQRLARYEGLRPLPQRKRAARHAQRTEE